MKLWTWFKTLLSGDPHFVIGGDRPYLLRWYLLPRNDWFNVYLHKFVGDDDDRALHDHPWGFLSLVLWGGYWEVQRDYAYVWRGPWSLALRPAEWRHRVMLHKSLFDRQPLPCWTLVITGPKVREWGFWCPRGFVPWREFVATDDDGAIGKGCD